MAITDLIATGIKPPEVADPLEALGKAYSLKNLVMQGQGLAMANEQRQRALNDDQAYRDIVMRRAAGVVSTAPGVSPAPGDPAGAGVPAATGVPPGLPAKPGAVGSAPSDDGSALGAGMISDLLKRGLVDKATAIQQQILKNAETRSIITKNLADGDHLKALAAQMRTEAMGDAMHGLLQLPEDQQATAWPLLVNRLETQGWAPKGSLSQGFPGSQALALEYASVAQTKKDIDAIVARNDEARKAQLFPYQRDQEQAKALAAGASTAGQTIAGVQDQAGYDAWRAALPASMQAAVPAMYSPAAVQAMQQRGMTAGEQTTTAQTAAHNKVEEQQGAQRVRIAAGELGVSQRKQTMQEKLLTPTDEQTLDMQADAFHSGVPLSQLVRGIGTAATAQTNQILGRVAQKYPGASIAGAQAGYKADAGSLNKLQASRDQVAAFENTAGKNLDQFLQTAKGVVDTGSPLINSPLRLVNDKLAGSANAAAFNVARQVAVTEIAKVLSNPGMSGQLSDSARHEVQDLIGPNATLKQIYTAAGILKNDMKNRADSMDQQIGEIKGRISGGTAQAAQQPPAPLKATHRFNPATGKVEAIQ